MPTKTFNVGFTPPPLLLNKKIQYWFRLAFLIQHCWSKDTVWKILNEFVWQLGWYVSEIARQLTYVTFEWSQFGQTKALSCIYLTHFAIPCVRVVAWMRRGRKWCQSCVHTFTSFFKRPSVPLFVHVLHSLYALESFRITYRNNNISTRRRAFTMNSQKTRSKEVFP